MKKRLSSIAKTVISSMAILVVIAGLQTVAPTATAHEGMEHISGTITSVGSGNFTLKNTKGKSQDIKVDDKTEYVQGKTAMKFTDLKVGDRIVVHAMDIKGSTSMYAHEVNIGTAKAAAKTTTKSK